MSFRKEKYFSGQRKQEQTTTTTLAGSKATAGSGTDNSAGSTGTTTGAGSTVTPTRRAGSTAIQDHIGTHTRAGSTATTPIEGSDCNTTREDNACNTTGEDNNPRTIVGKILRHYSPAPQQTNISVDDVWGSHFGVRTGYPFRNGSFETGSAAKIQHCGHENIHVTWSSVPATKPSTQPGARRSNFSRLRKGNSTQEDRGRGVISKTPFEEALRKHIGEPQTPMPVRSLRVPAPCLGHNPATSMHPQVENAKRDTAEVKDQLPFCRRQRGQSSETSVPHRDNHWHQPSDLTDLPGNTRTSPVPVSTKQKGQVVQRVAFRTSKARPRVRDEIFTPRVAGGSGGRRDRDRCVDEILGSWLRENSLQVPSLGPPSSVSKPPNGGEQRTAVLKVPTGVIQKKVPTVAYSKREYRFGRSIGLDVKMKFPSSQSYFGSTDSRCWETPESFDDSLFTTHAPKISVIHRQLFDDIALSNVFSESQLHSYRFLYDTRVYHKHSDIAHYNFRYPTSTITTVQHSCLVVNGICEFSPDVETSFAYIFTTPEMEKMRYRVVTDCLSSNMLCDDAAKIEFTPIRQVGRFTLGASIAIAIDMKAWYFQFMLSPKVRKYFQYKVESQLFQFTRLPMGFKNAGSIAHQTALYLAIISCAGLDIQFDVYVDNIIFFANDATIIAEALKRFKAHCNYYNCVVGEVSEISPTITYRGIQLDFTHKTIQLGTKFRNKFLHRMSILSGSWGQYRSIIGMLIAGYMALNIPLAEIYYSLKFLARNVHTHEGTKIQPWAAVEDELKRATKLFTANLPRPVTPNPDDQVVVITDACGENTTGAAIIVTPTGRIYTATYDLDSPSSSINDLETIVLHHALKQFPFLFQHKLIHAYADNTAMIATLTMGHSKSWFLNMAVRNTLAIVTDYRSRLALTYVPSKLNPSDGLSRDKDFSTQDRRLSKIIAAHAFDNFRRRLAEAV